MRAAAHAARNTAAVFRSAVLAQNIAESARIVETIMGAGGTCKVDGRVSMFVCTPTVDVPYFGGGTTYFSVFVTPDTDPQAGVMGHEFIHAYQWTSDGFIYLYLAEQAKAEVMWWGFRPSGAGVPSPYGGVCKYSGCLNEYEAIAGLRAGEYIR